MWIYQAGMWIYSIGCGYTMSSSCLQGCGYTIEKMWIYYQYQKKGYKMHQAYLHLSLATSRSCQLSHGHQAQLHVSLAPSRFCQLHISLVYVRLSGLAPSLSCQLSHQSMLGHQAQLHLSLALASYLISLCQAISLSASLSVVSSKGIATVSHFRLVTY